MLKSTLLYFEITFIEITLYEVKRGKVNIDKYVKIMTPYTSAVLLTWLSIPLYMQWHMRNKCIRYVGSNLGKCFSFDHLILSSDCAALAIKLAHLSTFLGVTIKKTTTPKSQLDYAILSAKLY